MTDPIDEPWEPAPGSDEGYALFAKERRVVADDGTPIAYTYRNPDGPAAPLLFASGWSCSDAYWGRLVPLLEAAGHPCIVADTRGHGRSGLPRSPGRGARNLTLDDVSMARIARDLVTVLDDAGVSHAVLVGHSMGVQSGLEVYRLVPDRMMALVLIAGTAANPAKTFYGSSIGDRTFPVLAGVVRTVPEVLTPIWSTIGPASVGHFGARLAKAAGPKATKEDLHPYLLHLRSVDPAVVVLVAAAMRAHDATDLLPEITVPTLVVAAGADVFTPARCSEAIHHDVAGSELVTFAEAGHTLPIEEPDALAAAIDDFLARRLPDAGAETEASGRAGRPRPTHGCHRSRRDREQIAAPDVITPMSTRLETTDATPLGWPAGLIDAYEEHWLALTRLAYLLTRDRAVAEELVQDVFVAARRRWSTIDNPAGYLRTSVVNATRDWARHQHVVRRHAPGPDQALEASSTHDAPDELWDALGRLDERRRRAVVLRFYLDLPDAEIAAVLACRPATVRTLIHRALRDLRREMTP